MLYAPLCFFPPPSHSDTDDPGAVLCLYKTDNDCVMKFTYSEHASGKSILTALKEPGQSPEQQQLMNLIFEFYLRENQVIFKAYFYVASVVVSPKDCC